MTGIAQFVGVPATSDRKQARGLVIALVGPDAAGKTTLANSLHQYFLACGRPSRIFHLGLPRGSRLTRLMRLALRGARKVVRVMAPESRTAGDEDRYPRLQSAFDLVLAYERLTLARRCHRLARRGECVVADRYPCAAVGSATGPQPARDASITSRMLSAQQIALYKRVPKPTLMVRLRVPVEETVRRNAARPLPKDESLVRASHAADGRARFEGVPVLALDSAQPPAELLAELIRAANLIQALVPPF